MQYFKVSVANLNQADDSLPYHARGRQCVPCCLMFLLTTEFYCMAQNIDSNCLDRILYAGSDLYCALTQSESNSTCISGYLDPFVLQGRIKYKDKIFGVKHICIYSGYIQENESNHTSLELAFLQSGIRGSSFIVVFSGIAIGIHYDEFNYYIFDSHSRNELGLFSPHGFCVMGYVKTIKELCTHIQRLSVSLGCSNSSKVQFDVHTFKFLKKIPKDLRTNPMIEITERRTNNLKRKVSDPCSNAGKSKYPRVTTLLSKHKSINFIDDRHCSTELSSSSTEISNFFNSVIACGPNFVCSCCTQTFFRHSVHVVTSLRETETYLSASQFLTGFISVEEKEWICINCLSAIKKGRMPKFWIHNGLMFPDRPKELELSNLEERLVSPRLPFMQLRELPRGGQISLKGNIVNVPADVNKTIRLLPRTIGECDTIMLKLKRRLSYKHHVAFENIRPNKVFEAAKWLVENSVLFKSESIIVNENWLLESCNHTGTGNAKGMGSLSDTDECIENISSDNWIEEENISDRPTGNFDTFLQAADFREFNQILCVAPCENNSPISLFQDYHSEALSFPSIYCGKVRPSNNERNVSLHYSDICKWELRNVDRRVALCVPNIFYKLKRLQIKQIKDKVSLAIRKCKTNLSKFTVGDILTPGFVEKLTLQDDGFRVLRTIRGSPPYWEQAKRDVFALVRQLGIPTWFCSFSAAETKWEPLLHSLGKLVNGKEFTRTEILNLNWQEKNLLIKSDPVTCARYFDFRFQCFIKYVLKNNLCPVGDIADFFYRVEFQQRGSPHVHMLIWIKNAPVYGSTSDADVIAFIDKYVSCYKDDSVSALINYQTHRHAKTCRKKGKENCRFNFPIPPMPETVILQPLAEHEQSPKLKEQYKMILKELNDFQQNKVSFSDFTDFLEKLHLTKEEYILSIRSSLSRATVFLKRSLSESRINNYNKTLIKSWQANMDIQYILDPYSCVSYIVSYISKGQRGLSNLLLEACHEAKEKDSDIRQQVRRIGNQFLSSVEIGAQEAAYLTLQLPLRRCTRDVIFVDTNKSELRTSLIKPFSQLKELPAKSNRIEMDNTLKRYIRRPKILENVCYSDFACWYELCSSTTVTQLVKTDEQCPELPEIEYDFDTMDEINEANYSERKTVEGNENGQIIKFACGTQMRRRTKQKVMYCHLTPINKDKEEYYMEQVMLFTGWRNEEKDLLETFDTYETKYLTSIQEIENNRSRYEKISNTLFDEVSCSMPDDCLNINVENQHRELLDECDGETSSTLFSCFDPGNSEEAETTYDLGDDLGISRQKISYTLQTSGEIDIDTLKDSVRSLNSKQKEFFYHILHLVKTNTEPFYIFLSGGAGVGKSVLIKTIYQALLKYLNHIRHADPGSLKILLCAPTGKAAHNIGGNTLHSAFCIPVSQGFNFKPLDMQQLNTLRSRFRDLKLVIIDEISMVGKKLFNFINLRLQELTGSVKPFGGVSVLAVGDLFQLKPVMDSWLFSNSNSSQLSSIGLNLWVELFSFFELTDIMRQKDDQEYALLLNRLREGKQTEKDIEVLNKRCIQETNINFNDLLNIPHIFSTRKDALLHNVSVISKLPMSDVLTVEAIDSVSGDLSTSLKETVISKISTDPTKTMGLSKRLTLGIGVPCDICLNIDVDDGLTNGASCVVRNFDFRVSGSKRCSIVWVEFDDKLVGKSWSRKYRHLYTSNINSLWVPILETTRKFQVTYFKTYLIVRRQFPLCISAGKTIHKAQGSTMKQSVMHFGTKAISHLHYVGLSRVSSLLGVHILKLNAEKIVTSPEVEEEMERLRSERTLKPSLPNLSMWKMSFKICFQNCRSLSRHFPDICKEVNLLSADILGLVETRVHDQSLFTSTYLIDGFSVNSSMQKESPHGIALYYKCSLPNISFHLFSNIECVLIKTAYDLMICFIYCSPSASSLSNYKIFMENIVKVVGNAFNKFILMGDFNFEVNDNISRLFENEYGLRQLIRNVTTDYDSCLDHIYTNINEDHIKASGTLESYYSDHKPIFLVFEQFPL